MNQTVTVAVKITYRCTGTWSPECTVGQVIKQGRVEALERLNAVLGKDPLVKNLEVGEVVVTSSL